MCLLQILRLSPFAGPNDQHRVHATTAEWGPAAWRLCLRHVHPKKPPLQVDDGATAGVPSIKVVITAMKKTYLVVKCDTDWRQRRAGAEHDLHI